MKIKYSFLLLFFLFSFVKHVYCQVTFFDLKGKIIDKNNTGIEYALIRINNSTLFTESDSSGNFNLKVPNSVFRIELVISIVGFETKSFTIVKENIDTNITITLENNSQLAEVITTAKRDKNWSKNLKKFKQLFLGDSQYAKDCYFKNPDDIIFEETDDDKLIVTFKDNLILTNEALGYDIVFDILRTVIEPKRTTYGVKSSFFKEKIPLNEKQRKKWKKNREVTFENSLRGYLLSLIKMESEKNYSVFIQNTFINESHIYPINTKLSDEISSGRIEKINLESFVQYDDSKKKYSISIDKPIMVFYHNIFDYNKNFVENRNGVRYYSFPDKSILFDKFGFIHSSYKSSHLYKSSGYAEKLPQEYLPEKYK